MRIDERTIMFSRMSRQPGTAVYDSYYQEHPEHLATDHALRAMPAMGTEGSATYNSVNSPMVDAAFMFLNDLKPLVEGPEPAKEKVVASEAVLTARIKGLAQFYGAKLVGIAPLSEDYYYSHRGRMDENFGQVIEPWHPYTIVYAVEMPKDMIFAAPQLQESIAVTKGYVDAAVIGMMLTYYIKQLGYEARNHMDGNYLMVLPLAAKAAGLGDIGRHGLLVTETLGSRIRLGAVTTNLPLEMDQPSDFDIQHFCEICHKCVRTCPAQTIPSGPAKSLQPGEAPRWQIGQEKCYEKWRILGTDCGVCLASCPFSDDVPEALIQAYKDDLSQAQSILEYHEAKYPIRPFNKLQPQWLSK